MSNAYRMTNFKDFITRSKENLKGTTKTNDQGLCPM